VAAQAVLPQQLAAHADPLRTLAREDEDRPQRPRQHVGARIARSALACKDISQADGELPRAAARDCQAVFVMIAPDRCAVGQVTHWGLGAI
jgi:hypothetical protein